MTEAARAVTLYCFKEISSLKFLRSGGLTENKASLRIMEKCGMTINHKMHVRFAKFNNEAREISEYSLTRDQHIHLNESGFYSK